MSRQTVRLTVNGAPAEMLVPATRTLLELLRRDLKLTGSKEGCLIGICGACTVLVDGRPIASCLGLVLQYDGADVLTIEGLAREDELDVVQQAFVERSAFQCGYCTAGMIMSAVGLLNRQSTPGDDDIKRAMDGNVCRCGTYGRIIAAVKRAATTASTEASHG